MNKLAVFLILSTVFGCYEAEARRPSANSRCGNSPSLVLNPSSVNVTAGESTSVQVAVTNNNHRKCNQDLINLNLSSNLSIDPSGTTQLNVQGGSSTTVDVTLSPAASLEGSYYLQATATVDGDSTLGTSFYMDVTVNQPEEQEPQIAAAVIDSVTFQNESYVINFHQPSGSDLPEGGYDTWINGNDQNDRSSYSGFSRTISGLDTSVQQCFTLETRYTQYNLSTNYPMSNEVCVAAQVQEPTCQLAAPSLTLNPTQVSGDAGTSFSFNATVTNNNQYCPDQNFNLSLSSLPSGASSNLQSSISIPSGGSSNIAFTVSTQQSLAAGNYSLQLSSANSSSSQYNAGQTLTMTINEVVEEPQIAAAVIDSAVLQNNSYVITFHQPAGTEMPEGGYDTWINGNDQNDRSSYSGFSRTISGLDTSVQQCFTLETRYTQYNLSTNYPMSNEVCVDAVAPEPVLAAAVIDSAVFQNDSYVITFHQPSGSETPAGGYDTIINDADQNDNASHSGFSRTISGLDSSVQQCFKLETRYTQYSSGHPISNQVCVAAQEQEPQDPQIAAAVIDSAVLENNNYVITFHQPAGTEMPEGSYDTWINGVDQNDRSSYSGFSRTISGLDTSVEQCFTLEARYTQYNLSTNYPMSNEVCVQPTAQNCSKADPSVSITPSSVSGTQGSSANAQVVIVNNNQYCPNQNYSISVSGAPSGMSASISSSQSIASGAQASLPLSLSFAQSLSEGNYQLQVSVTDSSQGSYQASQSLNVQVNQASTGGGDDISLNELLAFPGAQGFGKNTNGFRNGSILKVTNLNDSGPGSLRAALESTTPGYVIFEVSGYIDLNSTLRPKGSKYVAGQTAFRNGGQGITLRRSSSWSGYGELFEVKYSEMVIRYLRFRPGGPYENSNDRHAFLVYASNNSINNIYLDHNSFSWASDENVGFWGEGSNKNTNVSFAYNMVHECYQVGGDLSKGMLVGNTDSMTFLGNMYSNNHQRNPLIGGSTTYLGENWEYVNNIVYNAGGWGTDFSGNNVSPDYKINFIGNSIVRGPHSSGSRYFINIAETNGAFYYVLNNLDTLHRPSDAQNEWDIIGDKDNYTTNADDAYQIMVPFQHPLMADGYEPIMSQTLNDSLFPHVGAGLYRDAVDERQIINYNTNTGQYPSSPNDVGGYPSLSGMSSPIVDANNDGIDDNWASQYQINNAAGYPALELYLSEIAGDFERLD